MIFYLKPTACMKKRRFDAFFDKLPCNYGEDPNHHTWLTKPTRGSFGMGISIINNMTDFRRSTLPCQEDKCRSNCPKKSAKKITLRPKLIQKFISNPLVLRDHKVDFRHFVLIASTKPWLVLYRDGFVRFASEPFERNNTDNLLKHITNHSFQKQYAKSSGSRTDPMWSVRRFNEHVVEIGLAKEGFYEALKEKMKEIVYITFMSAKDKMNLVKGHFNLFGLDFGFDDKLNVYFLEWNVEPNMDGSDSATKAQFFPDLVSEVIEIVSEVNERYKTEQSFANLKSLRGFEVVYDESTNFRTSPC